MRKIETRFGHLSRGKCWGKWFAGKARASGDFQWCDKDGGTIYVPDGPGLLVYGSDDGFQRKEKKEVKYSE